MMAVLQTSADAEIVPPKRTGPRPRTRTALPHLQLEQWPPAEILAELMERSRELPYVRPRESRMASPESVALSLPDRYAQGPRQAFIDANEFSHLHPLPEGGIHLTLPAEIRAVALDAGWVEPHPASRIGAVPEELVLVSAARNRKELEVVWGLLTASYRFARWGRADGVRWSPEERSA